MATNIHRLSFKQALKDAEENIYEGIDNATLSVETQGYLNMESAKANMSSAASPKSYKLPPTIVKQTPVKTQLDDSHFCCYRRRLFFCIILLLILLLFAIIGIMIVEKFGHIATTKCPICGGDVSNATSEVNSTISNSMSESMTFWPTTVKPKLPMRKEERVAFFAYRHSNCNASAPVKFENCTVNEGSYFNTNTSSFTAPADGYYWFHLTALTATKTLCDYRLVGTHQTKNVLRMHTTYNIHSNNIITQSRDDLQWLNKGEAIYVTSDYALLANTSLASFRLDSLLDPFIAFAVGRYDNWNTAGLISFQTVIIDTYRSWNKLNNEFITPRSGTYFFTLNTGSQVSYAHTVYIVIKKREFCMSRMVHGFSGVETISRSAMANLFVGDTVGVNLSNGGSIYSDIRYQTSFVGFLYEPIKNAPKIAWSVHTDRDYTGPIDPLPFFYVIINEGSGWYSSHRFIVPVAGVYFVNINGQPGNSYYLEMRVLHNGKSVVSLIHGSFNYGQSSRSRSTIIRLQEGDELRVAIASGAALLGSTDRISSFSGFRLFD